MAHLTIGILNGDDIGHEIVPASVRIAKAAAARTGLAIDWRPMPIGHSALDTLGTTMPEDTLDKLSVLDGFILGPIGHRAYPKVPGAINPHPILRKHFGLFANVRPTRSYPGIGGLFDDVDLIIVRENNEGFQPDRNVVAGSGEFRPTHDTTISVRVITRAGSYRVAKAALELARNRRKKLTLVHKDTVFKLGCGMFVEECYNAAKEFPDVEVDEVIVDTFAMRLLRDPQTFDVVVTTNMFGDILSDEAAGLELADQRPGFLGREAERLLDDEMLAGGDRLVDDRGVLVGADDHGVDAGIGEELPVVGVAPGDAVFVAEPIDHLARQVAQSGDVEAGQLLEDRQMHELRDLSATYDADADALSGHVKPSPRRRSGRPQTAAASA